MASEPEAHEAVPAERDKTKEGGTDLDRLLDRPFGGVSLLEGDTPIERLENAEHLVKWMQRRVDADPKERERFISRIKDDRGNLKDYPKVDWWTAMGFALNLVPRLEGDVEEDPNMPGLFRATVAVWHTEQGVVVTRAQGFCSRDELTPRGNKRWRDEYAVRAMAQTRAIGRAYRGPLGGLAAMAGLQTTPAEEMTGVFGGKRPQEAAQEPRGEPAAGDAGDHPFTVGDDVEGVVVSISDEAKWKKVAGGRMLKWVGLEGPNGGKVMCATESNPNSDTKKYRFAVGDKVSAKVLKTGFFSDGAFKATIGEVRPVGAVAAAEAPSAPEAEPEPPAKAAAPNVAATLRMLTAKAEAKAALVRALQPEAVEQIAVAKGITCALANCRDERKLAAFCDSAEAWLADNTPPETAEERDERVEGELDDANDDDPDIPF